MAIINLNISTTNAAFEDEAGEVARILRAAADRLDCAAGTGDLHDDDGFALHDLNGNRVGEVMISGAGHAARRA